MGFYTSRCMAGEVHLLKSMTHNGAIKSVFINLRIFYLVPRAPTNTWNLWHQSHIDHFFDRLIQGAVHLMGANPNRVYFMGYSAGGDGVYQLAPRMADRLAAASMMAGHPNDASPLGS